MEDSHLPWNARPHGRLSPPLERPPTWKTLTSLERPPTWKTLTSLGTPAHMEDAHLPGTPAHMEDAHLPWNARPDTACWPLGKCLVAHLDKHSPQERRPAEFAPYINS